MSLERIQAFLETSDEVEFKAGQRGPLRMGKSDATAARSSPVETERARAGAALHSQDDGAEPGAGDALAGDVLARRESAARTIPPRRFAERYTRADAELLATVDEAHDTISGPATRKILQWAHYDFKDAQHTRLAELSVAQLYRMRKSRAYRQRLTSYQPAARAQWTVRLPACGHGASRRPGRNQGVYHINAVDEVTQWEVVGAAAQIGEAWLIPVLEAMLEQFPVVGQFDPLPNFRSAFGAFIPTTSASSSTTRWPNC